MKSFWFIMTETDGKSGYFGVKDRADLDGD